MQHFGEDFCRVEDKNVQQNLNMARKIAINSIKQYKENIENTENIENKRPISKIMLDCLLDPHKMFNIIAAGEN